MNADMTIRERMLAVYHGRPVDHPAFGIYERYLPRGSEEIKIREQGLGLICYHPMTTMLAPPWHFYEGFLSEVKNVELNVMHFWKNGARIERRSYETPVGTLSQESCLDAGGIGSEHIIKHYITDMEDYKIMSYIVENTVFTSNSEYIANRMEDLGEGGVMLGRLDRSPYQKCLIELAGPEQFLVDLFTEPEEVGALLEAMSDKLLESMKLSLDTPADVFWQPDNVTADMTPPNIFEKYCMPFYQRHVRLINQTGKPYYIHIDGKFRLLAELISKSGISGLESISVPEMGGDLRLEEARELLPNMVLLPNFPANLVLSEEEDIVSYVRHLREVFKDSSVMLQISEDILPHSWRRILPVLCRELD